MSRASRRATRQVRWYPREWRERNGTEFIALLEDSLSDRPFWPHRSLDLAWRGTRLRFAAGIERMHTDGSRRDRVLLQHDPDLAMLVQVFATRLAGGLITVVGVSLVAFVVAFR